MIATRRIQRSFADGFIAEEVAALREPLVARFSLHTVDPSFLSMRGVTLLPSLAMVAARRRRSPSRIKSFHGSDSHLLRFPAQNMKGRRRNILRHPIHPGATDDIDAVLSEELEVSVVFAGHGFLHIQVLFDSSSFDSAIPWSARYRKADVLRRSEDRKGK